MKQNFARVVHATRRNFAKYDGKDSADSSESEFLEVPLTKYGIKIRNGRCYEWQKDTTGMTLTYFAHITSVAKISLSCVREASILPGGRKQDFTARIESGSTWFGTVVPVFMLAHYARKTMWKMGLSGKIEKIG